MLALPRIKLNLFDSSRQSLNSALQYRVRLINGHRKTVYDKFHRGRPPIFAVEFFNNFGDDYTVIVTARKHHDSAFWPIKVAPGATEDLDLMLLPKKNRYNFANAAWERLEKSKPSLTRFIAGGLASINEARGRYEEMLDGANNQQDALACLHNLIAALEDIRLPAGRPLDYFKQLIWDTHPPRPDRFFAYADARLVEQVKLAQQRGIFTDSCGFTTIHPGATNAFKEARFGQANVQLTFYESKSDRRVTDGVDCVRVETDIDYFSDRLSHFLLEVLANAIKRNKTDPKMVYMLRWIAARRVQEAKFDPPYTIEVVTD
jgi:hypothetical protein